MSVPSTQEPQKIPVSQITRGPNALRFSPRSTFRRAKLL
jgi:hypothetical protein